MRRTKGFTLIELLVVIAIIALLVSILLPSLNRARELANRTACKSNVKNIGTALSLYKNEFNTFPFVTNGAGAGFVGTLDAASDNVYTLDTSIVDSLNLLVSAGSVGYKIFRCPSVGSEVNDPATSGGKYGFKYGTNIYIDYAYHVGYSTVTSTTANPAAFSDNMDNSMIILADKPGNSLAEFDKNLTTAPATTVNDGRGYNHKDEVINALVYSMSATNEGRVKSGVYQNNLYTNGTLAGTTVTDSAAAGAPGFAEDTVLIKGI